MERRVRVLIADDRQTTRKGLRALLTLYPQVEVVGEAGDGQEAMHFVAERHPDLVVMDMQMPVMDGLEATRRIKSEWPEVRVIALTMYVKYRAKALAAGADAFLLKGDRAEALQDAILAQVEALSAARRVPGGRSWTGSQSQ
jgi:DNA-binding NarL/FixJ family response regulator